MSLPFIAQVTMAATLLAGSLASAQSTAQLPSFDLERLETNVGRGTLLVGNGELMVPGGLSISLLGHYQRLPLEVDDGEQQLAVVRDRATALLSASYGVLPWLEMGVQVPFVLWQQGEDPTNVGLARLTAQGLGTPLIQARLGLLSRNYRQPVDLSADLGVGLPVGAGDALAGDTGPRFQVRMVAGTTIGWLHPSLEAGVLFRPAILLATPQGADQPGARSEIRLGAGLTTTGKGFRGELGLRATLSPQVSVDLLGGVRFPLLVGLETFILGGPGLGGAPGSPSLRLLAGVSFRSEPPPRLSFIDEQADRELQLSLADQRRPPSEKRVREVSTWEFNALSREDPKVVLAEEDAPPEAPRPYQPTSQERLLLRGDVHFVKGSSELPGVVPLLDQVILQWSGQARRSAIIIEGHADSEGTDTSEMFMSLRRAQAVRRYLIDQGIPGTKVRIRGLGADWPVSSKPATEQEHQLNRRAEVLVLMEAEAPVTTQTPSP
ncbi:OmpA family protein [Stigmatella sp. ncwal1]|uniref:OmpA family protein n=1 Tax=Stigmatella ashevillensis TaxID=2995309 RepID=A0ABT5DKC1_9BACT|nr:OmpA family protein [Stigmatella ashevillena]MDC0713578.1 OmpA family protein [Stigmatella ashevillena]